MFGSETLGSVSANKSESSNIIYVILSIVTVLLFILNFLQYYWGIDIVAYFKSQMKQMKEKGVSNIEVEIYTHKVPPQKPEGDYPVPKITYKEQVFNIPGNYYTYKNAEALCAAYDSRLAKYEEVEKAYHEGAEWCNYGWSDDQMVLFPTQKKTYDNLQAIPGHENDCGRPGINGGYIANPHARFGVNCYGHKPKITAEEAEYLETANPYPQSAEDIAFQKRVDFWKTQVDNILVSPYNYNTWSKL